MSATLLESAMSGYLPWHENEKALLSQLLESDRLPHALLLAGVQGIGKRALVRGFSRALLCQQAIGAVACGECRACQLISAGTHPDLLWVAPEEQGKQIKVDQVRALVDFSSRTSQMLGRKVIVVEPAEAMNINASNALLKCLEEPSRDTVLLLVTDRLSGLIATIRSRCQKLELSQPAREESQRWLESLVSDSEQAKMLLNESMSRPLAALALLESDGLAERLEWQAQLESLLSGQSSVPVLADQWQQGEPLPLLEWLIQKVVFLVQAAERGETRELAPIWQGYLSRSPQKSLLELWQSLLRQRAELQGGANPNPQLLIESLVMQLAKTLR